MSVINFLRPSVPPQALTGVAGLRPAAPGNREPQSSAPAQPTDQVSALPQETPEVSQLEVSQPAAGSPFAVSNPALGRVAYSGDTRALKRKLEANGVQLWGIRHGQSEMNAEKTRLPGQVETPLTEVGRREALDAAKAMFQSLGGSIWLREVALGQTRPPALYASPLSRASDTAQIFADYIAEQARQQGLKLNLPVNKEPRLLEIDFGRYDGRPVQEALKEHPELMGDAALAHRFPGGESRLDVMNRVHSFLGEVADKHQDQPVMMFCHLVPVAATKMLMGEGTVNGNGDLEIHRKDYPNARPTQMTSPVVETGLGYLVA